MSRLRTGIWILVLILLMLLFFQNQAIFLAQRSLRLNLYFARYQTPELYEGLFFLAALLIGNLIAYLFSLGDRFKSRRTIKQLASANDSQRQEIAVLRSEIEELKKMPVPQAAPETPIILTNQALPGMEKPPLGSEASTEPNFSGGPRKNNS